MIEILVLGSLPGMRDTLEADHVAAVATRATRSRGVRQAFFQGAAWGVGHTVTLFGLFLIPVFYGTLRKLVTRRQRREHTAVEDRQAEPGWA